MDKLSDFVKVLIEKLNVKQLLFSLLIVLGFIIVPKIDFLNYILPLDNIEKIIVFIFSLLVCFFAIEIIKKIFDFVKTLFMNKQKTERTLKQLQEEIELLHIEQKKIILDFLRNENKPKTISDNRHATKLYEHYSLLLRLPDTYKLYSRFGSTHTTSYDYIINPRIYANILTLYKSKRILFDVENE